MRGKWKDVPCLELCFLTSNEEERRKGRKDVKTRKENTVTNLVLPFPSMEELSWQEAKEAGGCEDMGSRG